jgi:hypothetical protein
MGEDYSSAGPGAGHLLFAMLDAIVLGVAHLRADAYGGLDNNDSADGSNPLTVCSKNRFIPNVF